MVQNFNSTHQIPDQTKNAFAMMANNNAASDLAVSNKKNSGMVDGVNFSASEVKVKE